MILVIKLSGKVLEDDSGRIRICRQVSQLARQHRMALVHGGGKQLTEMATRLGIPTVQHQGRRVTDAETLDLAIMLFSLINRQLVATLQRFGPAAVGLSGFDARITRCRRREPIEVEVEDSGGGHRRERVDFGLVADILEIDATPVRRLWQAELLPVISCLGADDSGQILNVNADTLAAELAVGLGADRLVSVSDVSGLYFDLEDSSSRIAQLSSGQARRYLAQGRFSDGMVPKVENALRALERGVSAVQVVGGLGEDELLTGLQGKTGTVLLP